LAEHYHRVHEFSAQNLPVSQTREEPSDSGTGVVSLVLCAISTVTIGFGFAALRLTPETGSGAGPACILMIGGVILVAALLLGLGSLAQRRRNRPGLIGAILSAAVLACLLMLAVSSMAS
jgi:hypothetical protein